MGTMTCKKHKKFWQSALTSMEPFTSPSQRDERSHLLCLLRPLRRPRMGRVLLTTKTTTRTVVSPCLLTMTLRKSLISTPLTLSVPRNALANSPVLPHPPSHPPSPPLHPPSTLPPPKKSPPSVCPLLPCPTPTLTRVQLPPQDHSITSRVRPPTCLPCPWQVTPPPC